MNTVTTTTLTATNKDIVTATTLTATNEDIVTATKRKMPVSGLHTKKIKLNKDACNPVNEDTLVQVISETETKIKTKIKIKAKAEAEEDGTKAFEQYLLTTNKCNENSQYCCDAMAELKFILRCNTNELIELREANRILKQLNHSTL